MIDSPVPPAHPRDYLASFEDWNDVAAILLLVLVEGRVPKTYRISSAWTIRFKLGLLQWMVSRQPDAEIQWQALEERVIPPATAERYGLDPGTAWVVPSRDSYVEKFWHSTAGDGPNQDVQGWLNDKWDALAPYQEHLFGWFIRRFDMAAAVRLVMPRLGRIGDLVPWLFPVVALWLFPVVALAVPALVLTLPAQPVFWGGALALVATALPMLILCSLLDLRPSAATELFIPRLAATVGIGYLFLAAAPELIGLLLVWRDRIGLQVTLAAGLVVAVLFYVMHHVSRRVTPRPRWRPLLLRGVTVTAVAVGHAAVGLAVFAPLLFSPEFLEFVQPGLHHPPGAHQLVLCGAIALAVGVVLELAWEEKPLTEPL